MDLRRTGKGLAGMAWRGTRTYSQFGEDLFVAKFFQGRTTGTWLDIGAFHPRVASNTEKLRRAGWIGVNVDADPDKIRLFRWFRRSEVNVHAAVAGAGGGRAVLRRHGGASYGSMDRLELAAGPGDVATRTAAEILVEAGVDRVDFVSIDVEGLEPAILAAYPFDRYPPELLCVEILDTALAGVTASEVTALLAEQGYGIVGWFPPSVFFARRPFDLGRG
jgi:FkbM family methyltransferase